jgi:DNA-binding transcriptional regulator YdaS (Cro superfamily)
MELRDYLHKNKIRKKEFSIRIGYSIPYIGRVCEYLRRPSERLAKAIEDGTNGEVSVHELLTAEYKSDKK